MKNEIHKYLISLGFNEEKYFYSIGITVPKIAYKLYCNIDKDDLELFDDIKYVKQYILQCINDTKIQLIKQYLGEQKLTEENIKTLHNFIEALGYKQTENNTWELTIKYITESEGYCDKVILEEEKLKEMTLNDAMLFAINSKQEKEMQLEFQMKYEMEDIKNFLKNNNTDCPNCL